jgi:hypothetical protein
VPSLRLFGKDVNCTKRAVVDWHDPWQGYTTSQLRGAAFVLCNRELQSAKSAALLSRLLRGDR